MYEQDLIDRVMEQLHVPTHSAPQRKEQKERLFSTLDRFCTHLREDCGIEGIEDTTLDALRLFQFSDSGNDDHHLRLVFSHLGRSDLTEFISMVSAAKYFRNKKLTVVFKAMDELRGYVKSLRQAGVRMASELLERGATPDDRAQLAEITKVPADLLLLMVHCCDLCRMTGMAGQTLRRARAMGYDTLAKFRASTPEQIEAELDDYLSATGERTNRMVSFSSFVRQARKLEDVVTGD